MELSCHSKEFCVHRNFVGGGIAKPLMAFLGLPKANLKLSNYSNFSTKPHWNYVSWWMKICEWLNHFLIITFSSPFYEKKLIRSTMQNFGHEDRGHDLRPRTRGTLAQYETGINYQSASKWCVEKSPLPYTWQSFVCSGIIDFGISAFIESQTWLDLLVCTASGRKSWFFLSLR